MNIDKDKLRSEQKRIADEVILRDEFDKIKLLAGVDISYYDNNKMMVTAIVVCNYKTMEIIEKKYSVMPVKFPYIANYLGYREGPGIVDVFSKLENKPDVLMIDGNGIIHPRKLGLASHIGLMLDISTLGVSKNITCGKLSLGKVYMENDFVGIQVKTKEHGNPLYVSPGHKITIGTSLDVVEHSVRPPHKMPEPIHLAHKYARKIKKDFENKDKE